MRVIYVGGGGAQGQLGPFLSYPIDVLDTPADTMSGALTPGVVIGVYRVRARAAVVLTAPVKAMLSVIPEGTVLARYTYKSGAATKAVWCDDGDRGVLRFWIACFEDDGGRGSFTQLIKSVANESADPSGPGVLQLGAPLSVAPAPYRAARPDELPVTQIGYRLCDGDGDGVKTPFRFSSVILRGKHGWSGANRHCPFGEWPNTDDKDTETVDGLKLHITRTSAEVGFVAASTLAPGPLADFGSNGPIRALGSPDPADLRKAEAHAAPPLVLTGLAQVQTTGTVQAGMVIASAPVVHGLTGVLRNDVTNTGLFGVRSLPAGQYVFGVPVKAPDGSEDITWCAPRADKGGRIATVCFPRRGPVNLWQPTTESLMPTGRMSLIGVEAADFSVERKAVSFPTAMTLTYRFSRWYAYRIGDRRIMVAELKVAIETGGFSYPVGLLTVSPAKDGGYRFPIQNSVITLVALNKAGDIVKPPVFVINKDEFETFFQNVEPSGAKISAIAPTVLNNVVMLNGMCAMDTLSAAPPPAAQATTPSH